MGSLPSKALSDIPPGLGLGCWEFSGIGTGPPDDEASIRIIRAARDMGVTHFDTAQGYGEGHAESVVGETLAPSDTLFIASKRQASDKDSTISSVHESLVRLRREWIDLFYIHWPRKGFDLRPMMEGLEKLRAQGLIRKIGVSNFTVADMEQAAEAGRIDAHQICYNLLWRFPERDVIPYCIEHGIALVTYSTIAQGLLSDTTRGPETFAKGDARAATIYYKPDVWPHVREAVQSMQAVARQTGLPLSTLAIQWVLARPGVVSVLVGARSMEQLRKNVQSASARIEPSVESELSAISDQAGRYLPDVGNIFLYYP
ncbi:MAG: aldo/keto reductase [Spirochaetia bacterium]|jgi:aryl-alcohol dehydrogenase-like predicted oxidoreductase